MLNLNFVVNNDRSTNYELLRLRAPFIFNEEEAIMLAYTMR